MFKKFKPLAIEALERSKGRYLQVEPTEINIIWLSDYLRELGFVTIVSPGKAITADFVRKAYHSGTIYAGMTLKRAGIEMTVGEGPADWRSIDALKVRNLGALKGINDEMNKKIISELTEGMTKGETIPVLAKRISESVNGIGIQRATVMARTETINAVTQGTIVRFQQAGVETVEWITAQDERVCPQCGPLNGEVFRLDGHHEVPALHPMCRCSLLPVIE